MTLKDVQAASGFSATHISEIERGRTSPTVGALLRIAAALGRDPAFFLDEESGERAVWIRGAAGPASPTADTDAPLWPSGGSHRLGASRLRVDPGQRRAIEPADEIAGFVLTGRIRLGVGEGYWDLGPGDGFHVVTGAKATVENRTEDAGLLLVFGCQRSGA